MVVGFHNPPISLLKVTIIKMVKYIFNKTRLGLAPPTNQLCEDLLQIFIFYWSETQWKQLVPWMGHVLPPHSFAPAVFSSWNALPSLPVVFLFVLSVSSACTCSGSLPGPEFPRLPEASWAGLPWRLLWTTNCSTQQDLLELSTSWIFQTRIWVPQGLCRVWHIPGDQYMPAEHTSVF